jgi:hypothetical protein
MEDEEYDFEEGRQNVHRQLSELRANLRQAKAVGLSHVPIDIDSFLESLARQERYHVALMNIAEILMSDEFVDDPSAGISAIATATADGISAEAGLDEDA